MTTVFPSYVPARPRQELVSLVNDLAASPDLWRHLVAFRAPARYWAKLVTRPDVDVWLLTWLHDQRTQFHDHGDSLAAFTVVEGSVRETRPAPSRRHVAHRQLQIGQTATVAPHVVHSVANPDQSRPSPSTPIRRRCGT